MADRYYYLAPWQWVSGDEPRWEAPEGTVGLIDLRPLTETATFGFFASEKPLAEGVLLGRDLNGLARGTRGAWNDTLGLQAQGDSILDLLAWTLDHGDPDGAQFCPPLMPTHKGIMEIHLGGHSLVRSRAWLGESDPAWPSVQAKLQRDYREVKRDAEEKAAKVEGDKKLKKEEKENLAKGAREQSAKWLGAMELKFKVSGDLMIPGDMVKEPSKKPTTSFSENFNKADGLGLDNLLTWSLLRIWATASGRAIAESEPAGQGACACVGALSSSDHLSRAVMTNKGNISTSRFVGVAGRVYSTSFESWYTVRVYSTGLAIGKYSSAYTQLASTAHSLVDDDMVQIICNGSTISSYGAGTFVESVTDSSFSSGLYCGLNTRRPSTGSTDQDDFYCEDLIAATPFSPAWARNSNIYLGSVR